MSDQPKALRLTPWFPLEQPPVRPGVYMVDQSWPGAEVQSVYAFFDGEHWYPQDSTPRGAMYTMCYGVAKGRPFKQWRGMNGAEHE